MSRAPARLAQSSSPARTCAPWTAYRPVAGTSAPTGAARPPRAARGPPGATAPRARASGSRARRIAEPQRDLYLLIRLESEQLGQAVRAREPVRTRDDPLVPSGQHHALAARPGSKATGPLPPTTTAN